MEQVFLKLLNMSITAGYLVLATLLFRLLVRRAPKLFRCVLWGLVALRLLLPISVQSRASVIPSVNTVPPEIVTTGVPQIHSGIAVMNHVVNPVLSETFSPVPASDVNPVRFTVRIAVAVWIAGVVAMLIYALVSFLRVKRTVRESARVEKGIYLCDRISSPFILGVLHPRIYLPSDTPESDWQYILAHEKAHLRRLDHLWKPFGFFLLAVYWFNPLLWVAYGLFCRDVELACDEQVLKTLGENAKKPYSRALIRCSAPRRSISVCPLAFGEDGVRTRVKSILCWKKSPAVILAIAILICALTASCMLTDPVKVETETVRDPLADQTPSGGAFDPDLPLTLAAPDDQIIVLTGAECYAPMPEILPFSLPDFELDTEWESFDPNTICYVNVSEADLQAYLEAMQRDGFVLLESTIYHYKTLWRKDASLYLNSGSGQTLTVTYHTSNPQAGKGGLTPQDAKRVIEEEGETGVLSDPVDLTSDAFFAATGMQFFICSTQSQNEKSYWVSVWLVSPETAVMTGYYRHSVDLCLSVAVTDLDGDGEREVLMTQGGPTSGIASQDFFVFRNGKTVYREMKAVDYRLVPMRFLADAGRLRLQAALFSPEETKIFDICYQKNDGEFSFFDLYDREAKSWMSWW